MQRLDGGEVEALEDAVAVAQLIAERFGHHPLLVADAQAVRDAVHAMLDDAYAVEVAERQASAA